jgi:hypothetical protein
MSQYVKTSVLRDIAAYFMLVSCLAYYSTLKMEAICSSETYVDLNRTTRRFILDDRTLISRRSENLKSNAS